MVLLQDINQDIDHVTKNLLKVTNKNKYKRAKKILATSTNETAEFLF